MNGEFGLGKRRVEQIVYRVSCLSQGKSSPEEAPLGRKYVVKQPPLIDRAGKKWRLISVEVSVYGH